MLTSFFVIDSDRDMQSLVEISTGVFVPIERIASVGICVVVLANTAQQACYMWFETTKFVDTLFIPVNLLSDALKYVLGISLMKYMGRYITGHPDFAVWNFYCLLVAVVMWALNLYLLHSDWKKIQ